MAKTTKIKYAVVKKMVAKDMSTYAIGKKLNVAAKAVDRCLEYEEDVEYTPRKTNGTNGHSSNKKKVDRAQSALEAANRQNGHQTDQEALMMLKGVALLEGKPVMGLIREMFETYRKAQKRKRG